MNKEHKYKDKDEYKDNDKELLIDGMAINRTEWLSIEQDGYH